MWIMELSDLVRSLLSKRGIESDEHIRAFLQPDYALHTHAPELLAGMAIAAERILGAIARNERVAIYADFDCDGIPGAAVLSDFFAKIGYANTEVYLPHRDREGYGFHEDAIAALAARDVKLIITVDVGTTALSAVRFAREKGVDVIVTDHHEITGALPDAVAVLNPKRAPYPFPHLCGAAVAFKLVQATLTAGKARGIANFLAVADGWEKWLLDLVAIATVADMVPLIGENRVLAHWGLMVLRKSPRPGIAALCNKLRLKRSELTEDDIGFSIAPRINAASRMDEPALALRLLTTQDPMEAEHLAAQLEKLNASRKGVVGSIVREARKRTEGRYAESQRVVVVGDPEWKPALLGLAANSIMNERGGMVCLWGRDAMGRIKGSCRSDGSLSVVDVFARAEDAFEEYGGHSASGGFSVSHEQVHTLPEIMEKAAQALTQAQCAEARSHDALVTLREVAWPLYRDISKLAPFGVGNPKPIFRITSTEVKEVKRFGKEKNHVELALVSESASGRAFDFFRAPEDFTHVPAAGSNATLLVTIERDTFRGGLALRIIDVLSA
ncbi:MAG: single-stranded-DNA-specific exonuclease RecJ [Candidatus Paceibacterota bacterium]